MSSFFEKLGSVRGEDSLALQAGSDEIRRKLIAARNSLESLPLEHAGQLAASLRIEIRHLRESLGRLAEDSERRFSSEMAKQRKAIAGLEDQLEDRARWLQVQGDQIEDRARWFQIQGDQIEALTEALTSVQGQLDERTRWLQIQSESIDRLHKELETIKESSPNPVKITKD